MLKVHIGLSLASRVKRLPWSCSKLILDATQSSDRSFRVKSVYPCFADYYCPSANTRVFGADKNAWYWTKLRTPWVSRRGARGRARRGARWPAVFGCPTVTGETRRHRRRAPWAGHGRTPSAGISPKDGTEHGLSVLVTRLETKSRGFAYEAQDPLVLLGLSPGETGTALLRHPLRKSCSWWRSCTGRQTHREKQEKLAAKVLTFPNLIRYTPRPTVALSATPPALD